MQKSFQAVGFLLLLLGCSAREQSIRIVGQLTCRNLPEQFAELQLINYNVFSSNDVMSRDVFTDPSGFFEIGGNFDQRSGLKGELWIWHRCWEKAAENQDPCWRKIEIKVPELYVRNGALPDKTWNMGVFRLDKAGGQSTDAC